MLGLQSESRRYQYHRAARHDNKWCPSPRRGSVAGECSCLTSACEDISLSRICSLRIQHIHISTPPSLTSGSNLTTLFVHNYTGWRVPVDREEAFIKILGRFGTSSQFSTKKICCPTCHQVASWNSIFELQGLGANLVPSIQIVRTGRNPLASNHDLYLKEELRINSKYLRWV